MYCKLVLVQLKIIVIPLFNEHHYSSLGFIYFELGKDLKSIVYFEKSQSLHNGTNPNLTRFNCFYLGYCYLNTGYFKKAIKNFEIYLLFDKSIADIFINIGECYEYLYEYEKALDFFCKALSIEKHSFLLQIELSEIMHKLNRNEEAIKLLGNMEDGDTNPILIDLLHALKSKYNGEVSKACEFLISIIEKKMYASFVQENDFQIDFNYMLAKFQKENGDSKGALKTLEKVFKNNPGDLWIINDLVVEYAEQNINLDYALNLIEKALRYQPYNSYFIDTKGMVLSKLGRDQEALVLFEKSLELNPNCKDTINHYNELSNKG